MQGPGAMVNTVRTIPSGPSVFTSTPDFIAWVAGAASDRPAGAVLTVVDPAAVQSSAGQQLLGLLHEAIDMRSVPPAPDENALLRLSDLAGPADIVIGIGGGTAMDTAKLIPALRDPSHRRNLTSRSRAGHVLLRDKPELNHLLALVPTTLGTGSETGLNACISDGSRKRLVSGLQLRANAVLLDAGLTASLPMNLILSGALEAMFRLSTPLILSGSPRRSSDTLALASIRALVEAGHELRRLGNDDLRAGEIRQDIAELSSFSQSGWSSLGRNSYGTLPWVIASELSMVAGVSKMDAVAAILPAYWRRVESGDMRFGDAARLRNVDLALATSTPFPSTASTSLEKILTSWDLNRPLPLKQAVIQETTQKISRAWGGGLPMMQGLTAADIAAFLTEAADARHGLDGGRATGAA